MFSPTLLLFVNTVKYYRLLWLSKAQEIIDSAKLVNTGLVNADLKQHVISL